MHGILRQSLNVHGLLHCCADLWTHEILDNFSAFSFEFHMQTTRKWISNNHVVANDYLEKELNFMSM